MVRSLARVFTGGDVGLLVLLVLALLLGFFAVFDAGFAQGDDVFGNMGRHGVAVMGFFLILWGMGKVPARYRAPLVLSIYFFTLVLLILVMIPKVGIEVNGARRWLAVGGVRLQPSELLKPATILFVSYVLALKVPTLRPAPNDRLAQVDRWFTPMVLRWIPVALVLVSLILIESQPDLGTAIIVGAVAWGVMLFAGVRARILFAIVLVGVLGIGIYVGLREYRRERVATHFERWLPENVRGPAFQPAVSEAAIALGGVWGAGIGEGRAKHVLPAATTDFVFTTLAEETGLWGSLVVLSLLGGITILLLRHAGRQKDVFSRCVIGGVGWWIGVQSILNLLMVGALAFPVGVPLPFFSYGGSSLFALGVGLGAVNWLLRNQGSKGA